MHAGTTYSYRDSRSLVFYYFLTLQLYKEFDRPDAAASLTAKLRPLEKRLAQTTRYGPEERPPGRAPHADARRRPSHALPSTLQFASIPVPDRRQRMLPHAASVQLEYHGAVAQLGERCVRNAEVEGSIPFRSTILAKAGSPAFCFSIQPATPGFSAKIRLRPGSSVDRAVAS